MEPTMLRTDRLEAIAGTLADAIEAQPIDLATLPPAIAAAAKIARTFGRVDLAEVAKSTVTGSLRRLPELARSDPARADRLTAWAVHAIAWLAGQIDEPPPALEL